MTTFGNAPPFGFQPVTGVATIAANGAGDLCCFNFSQALGNDLGMVSITEYH